MKKINAGYVMQWLLVVFFSFKTLLIKAQDSTLMSQSATAKDQFVMQPWMWLAGAAVVLVVVIMLLTPHEQRSDIPGTAIIRQLRN